MPELRPGEERQVAGSGRSWTIKRVGDVYSCNCPAWRNQSRHPSYRTCKHLRRYRGDAAEEARIAPGNLGYTPPPPVRQPYAQPAARRPAPYRASAPAPARPAPPPPPAPPPNVWDRLKAWDEVFDGPEPPPPPVAAEPTAEEAKEFAVLLAHSWDGTQDPTDWWMSEKLDGVRAYWDGEKFISRLGNVFDVPAWYKAEMPMIALDGEFWMDRGRFQETSGIVRRQGEDAAWRNVNYRVFDAPEIPGGFEARMQVLNALRLPSHVGVLTHTKCKGVEHLKQYLASIEAQKGEGVMLRKPGSKYVRARSDSLLKVKSFYDAEAQVVGYTAGKGKHSGKVGALQCQIMATVTIQTARGEIRIPAGKKFKVGTGLSDAQRSNPPAVGAIITFRFQELTNDLVPRFPSFVGERNYE